MRCRNVTDTRNIRLDPEGFDSARPDERFHGEGGAAPRRAALHVLPLQEGAQRAQPRPQEALLAQALQE